MSVNNKPHASVPVVVSRKDNFGNDTFVMSNEWFEYFDAIGQELNVTLINTINNTTQSIGTTNAPIGVELDRLSQDVANLKRQINLEPAEDHRQDIQEIKALLAQLLATQEEPKRDDTTWLSRLGSPPE